MHDDPGGTSQSLLGGCFYRSVALCRLMFLHLRLVFFMIVLRRISFFYTPSGFTNGLIRNLGPDIFYRASIVSAIDFFRLNLSVYWLLNYHTATLNNSAHRRSSSTSTTPTVLHLRDDTYTTTPTGRLHSSSSPKYLHNLLFTERVYANVAGWRTRIFSFLFQLFLKLYRALKQLSNLLAL